MESIAFDTHSFVKRLTKAGMPEPQAEVLAEEQSRLLEYKLASKKDIEDVNRNIEELRLASKRDIEEVKRDIEELRTEIKRDIRESEQRITIRLGTVIAVAVTAIAALIKLV